MQTKDADNEVSSDGGQGSGAIGVWLGLAVGTRAGILGRLV